MNLEEYSLGACGVASNFDVYLSKPEKLRSNLFDNIGAYPV
jgi:hypothetical protein